MSIESQIKNNLGYNVISNVLIKNSTIKIYKILTDKDVTLLAKYQEKPNDNLINQAKELDLLRDYIHTPEVIWASEQYQVLEWIEEKKQKNYQIQIGWSLANLHRATNSIFGFDFDNTIGEMPQFNAINTDITSWKEFYWQHRLKYQIEYAYNSKLLDYDLYERLLSIEPKLNKYLDNTIKPALLHGDLWSGNVINGKDNPYFIDSASYFGHREIDFALIHMFGGFSDDFFKAYNEKYKLDEGFEQRKPIYMLYHYLNHLNIFGKGYCSGVESCTSHILNH
ncbi:MAG: fructosamine kinase family protein [Gammaproteobacteria bacterium]|nr:fructosamine kinase family protein [Gammaproteobacteria bacterium]